jgi:hypothetical protein
MEIIGRLKSPVALLLCCTVAALAIYQKLEYFALAAFFGCLVVVYRRRVVAIIEDAVAMLKLARAAKIGALELDLQRLGNVSELLEKRAEWIRLVLAEMQPQEVAVLLSIPLAGRADAPPSLKGRLRALRDRGLLQHDEATMEQSSHVWLTEMGRQVAEALMGTTKTDSNIVAHLSNDGRSTS